MHSDKSHGKTLDMATAQSRLSAAIERLESALGKSGKRPGSTLGGDLDALRREVAGLRAERDRMLTELRAVQRDRAQFNALAAAMGGRIDTAVGEIKALLAD
jgi:Domain of unknown function (DUF4164)